MTAFADTEVGVHWLNASSDLFAEDSPIDIGPKLFAADPTASGSLDRWAVLGRNALAFLPHAWRTSCNIDGGGERGNAPGDLYGSVEGRHGGVGCAHVRECTLLTIVKQEADPITNVTTISDRVKETREALGLSQVALAKAAGVAPGTIGNLEAGTRKNPRELLAIASALRVNAEWLKSGKGPKTAITSGSPPPPPRDFSDRHAVDDSDWAVLQDIAILPKEEREKLKEELHARAAKYREYAEEVLATVDRNGGRRMIYDDSPSSQTREQMRNGNGNSGERKDGTK